MSAGNKARQEAEGIADPVGRVPLVSGLSSKLLVLTAVFVLIAESLIFLRL